jgi:peptidoglycan hydrolase-like protein with peptidoglycan-binding domain
MISRLTCASLFATALVVADLPAAAQAPAPAPAAPVVDPALQRAQAAFEALPEPERRQIQLDLNFAADFSGAALGTFGPLTYRALLAFERQNKSPADGILDPAERAALAVAAKAARDRVGFRMVTDPATKAVIGLPLTLLPKAEPQAPGGARWQSADGKATVALRAPAAADGTLEQLYEKALQSPNPQRKVTYKLLRPDFYVVAGETPQGRFFQRLAKLPDGTLRGFTVSYDKSLAPAWDKLTVAAANTFNPTGAPSGAPAATRAPAAPPPPPDPFAPRRFERSLTAVVVAPGRALTAAAAFKACPQPRLGGQPARLVAEDAAVGLALIQADGLSSPPLAATLKAGGEGVGILAPGAGPDGLRTLLALPGELNGSALSAPLQPGAAGAPLFGPGGLAGLVVSDPSARLQVAGVVLSARHQVADAAAIEQFLKAQGVALSANPAPAVGLGGLSVRHGRSVLAVACAG